MAGVHPLPTHGGVFLDDRGEERSLRVTWHHPSTGSGRATPDGIVVLSLWRGGECVGTFRLEADEVEGLVAALRSGQVHDPGAARHDRAC
jgi:hypothetical protein